MPNLISVRLLGAAALLSVSALAAMAQQSPPSQPPATEKPPLSKPATSPGSSQAKPAAHPLIGLNAISIDGSKVGDVRAVKTSPDGKVTALHIRSGGFLGLGGKLVAIPEGKFVQKGDSIHLSLTAEEVSKLPEVKDAS
jgi:PRC-barrel domain